MLVILETHFYFVDINDYVSKILYIAFNYTHAIKFNCIRFLKDFLKASISIFRNYVK